MLMKKVFLILSASFIAVGICLPLPQGQAAEASVPAVGISKASEHGSFPSQGMSYDPLPPGDISSSPVTAKLQEPVAVRKDTSAAKRDTSVSKQDAPSAKIEIADKKENKKGNKRGKKAEDKARAKALAKAVRDQVETMRAERSREMPYLDKVYIRTTITPLKVQQKDEFLSGGPKDLQSLILRAQAVHTQAKAAHENIALYNRRMLMAFRKLFPEATFALNERLGTQIPATIPIPYTGKDWKISLRQPIFSGGVLWNTFLQEKANMEAAHKQYDKTLAELVFDLSRAYFEYQRTLQTVEEQRAEVEKMKRFADMSEEKFNQKIISEIERLNVQSLYSQMQFDLESANQDFELAKIEIQKYLDLSVNDQFTLAKIYDLDKVVQGQAIPADSAAGAKTLPGVFKGDQKAPELSKLIDLSYGHRAELQVEAAKLQAARLGERVRWGEFLPKAFLSYDFGSFGEAYRPNPDDFDPATPTLKKQWRLMLEMNWNFGGNKVAYTFDRDYKAPTLSAFQSSGKTFIRKNGLEVGVLDGLDAYVGVKQAEVDKLNQVVELEKAEKQVLQDVKQAYYDYQKSSIQVNSTVKRLEYRKRLRDFAEHRLNNKEIELSEYLQAESDLVREKAELHKALKDYFSAKAAINHAVGIQDFFSMEALPEK